MTITTSRLLLDHLTLFDTETVFAQSQELSRRQGIPNEVYHSLNEAEQVVLMIRSHYGSDTMPYVLAIRLKHTSEMIGHISLSKIPSGVEVGYAIGESFQGHGFASEAVMAFIPKMKERFSADTIYGLPLADNIASQRVLENAGFRFLLNDLHGQFAPGGKYKVYCI